MNKKETSEKRIIQVPFIKEELEHLKSGDYIYLTGTIYTARDAAHKRLYESMLKEEEQKLLGWSAKRELAKINYHIHTDAIKQNLIPQELTPAQKSFVYADEADMLNVAMFGKTAREWREENPDLKGNIRDYASINQLICLSNMENLNAVFINEGLSQSERLEKLNKIAIQQMKVLENVDDKRFLKLTDSENRYSQRSF